MTASITAHVLAIAACLAASTRISSGAPLALHAADEPDDLSAHDGEGADVRTRRGSDWLGIFSNTMATKGPALRGRRETFNDDVWTAKRCKNKKKKGLCGHREMQANCATTCEVRQIDDGLISPYLPGFVWDELKNGRCKKVFLNGKCDNNGSSCDKKKNTCTEKCALTCSDIPVFWRPDGRQRRLMKEVVTGVAIGVAVHQTNKELDSGASALSTHGLLLPALLLALGGTLA